MTKTMTTRRRTLAARAFDARSVLLFAALALGGAVGTQAQQKAPTFGPAPSIPPATPVTPAPTAPAPSAAAAAAAFERADGNHDGHLSPPEAAALPAVAERFEQWDTDRDGRLSRAEFDRGLAS